MKWKRCTRPLAERAHAVHQLLQARKFYQKFHRFSFCFSSLSLSHSTSHSWYRDWFTNLNSMDQHAEEEDEKRAGKNGSLSNAFLITIFSYQAHLVLNLFVFSCNSPKCLYKLKCGNSIHITMWMAFMNFGAN